jgi:hypothetical protein
LVFPEFKPADPFGEKHLRIDWFADVVIHPGCKASLPVFLKGIGRHRQNWGAESGAI